MVRFCCDALKSVLPLLSSANLMALTPLSRSPEHTTRVPVPLRREQPLAVGAVSPHLFSRLPPAKGADLWLGWKQLCLVAVMFLCPCSVTSNRGTWPEDACRGAVPDPRWPCRTPAPGFALAPSQAVDGALGNSQSVVLRVSSEPLCTAAKLLPPGTLPRAGRAGPVQVRVLRCGSISSHAKVAPRAALSSPRGPCPRQGTQAAWRAHPHVGHGALGLGIKWKCIWKGRVRNDCTDRGWERSGYPAFPS